MSAAPVDDPACVLARCPLCGESDAVEIAAGDTVWVRCACATIYKRAQRVGPSTEASLGDAEDAREVAPGGDAHYDEAYFGRYARRRRRRIAKSRRQILDALEVAPVGPLLDVGCSLGYAMEAARGLGLEAYGVDLAPAALDACRRLGFDAREGTLERLPFEDGFFAVVVLKHVFEHTASPRAALAELKRVAKPGAAFFFAVPNAGYFKAARRPATSRFFRGEAGRAHFVCWSPATLGRLLEEEGFRVASVHPRLLHRRLRGPRRWLELVAAPLRVPLRLAADALGLRKEFWLVAVRARDARR